MVFSDVVYLSGLSLMRELSNVYLRKSFGWFGLRERIIGYDWDGKYFVVVGISDKGRRVWKRDEEYVKRNKRIWKVCIVFL